MALSCDPIALETSAPRNVRVPSWPRQSGSGGTAGLAEGAREILHGAAYVAYKDGVEARVPSHCW